MGKVIVAASVSLDGYIAGPDETGFEHLFAWYEAGAIEFPSALPSVRFSLTPVDHAYVTALVESVGALVVGRRLFDLVDGWGGTHPFDRPVVVVTHRVPEEWVAAHPGAPFTFVTDGIQAAVVRACSIAGDRDVAVNAGTIARQCLELGLLDEVRLDLAPVILGGGVRFFDPAAPGPVLLDGPEVIEGTRVTHLRYTLRKEA